MSWLTKLRAVRGLVVPVVTAVLALLVGLGVVGESAAQLVRGAVTALLGL